MDRNETIKKIKSALKTRTGRAWSVTGGRGTAWGWIRISSTKAHADQWGDLTPADRALLAETLGLDSVHHQGISIPSSNAYYQEYIDRAEGRAPSVVGKPYWD